MGNQKKISNDLAKINLDAYKDDLDKLDFLGKPKFADALFCSTNRAKISELMRALKSTRCWDEPIFSDRNLPYYAMTAFLENKITRDEISQILEFFELKSTFPSLLTFPILTLDGKFTIKVQEFLLQMSQCERSDLPKISPESIEQFRLALFDFQKKSGATFCVLYQIPDIENDAQYSTASNMIGALDSNALGFLIFPIVVRNIFLPCMTPKNSTKAKSLGRLGHFSIDDNEVAHRKKERLEAIAYPDMPRTYRVHGATTTQTDGSMHDAQHLVAVSYFPEKLYQASLRCLAVLRDKTGFRWSAETWPLIDSYVIDSSVSVLTKQETNGSLTPTFTEDGALAELQCARWLYMILRDILNPKLRLIILRDMLIHKNEWAELIDVDIFFRLIDEGESKFTQAYNANYDLKDLPADNMQQLFYFGFICNWPFITETVLAQHMRFSKNYKNKTTIYLFQEPLDSFNEDALRMLINHLQQENLAGINLIEAAKSNSKDHLQQLLESDIPTHPLDYTAYAMRTAAHHGHTDALQILLNHRANFESDIYVRSFADTAHFGYSTATELLLKHLPEKCAKETLTNAFLEAIRHQHKNIVTLLLTQALWGISKTTISIALMEVLDRDDCAIAEILLNYAKNQNLEKDVLSQLSIDCMLRNSPQACIPLLTKVFSPHLENGRKTLFAAIAKTGSVECAKTCIQTWQKQNIGAKELMECLLEGFLPRQNVSMHFCAHANWQHPMVAYQIDAYLTLAAQDKISFALNIERLLNTLFTTPCELGFYFLIQHELFQHYDRQKLVNRALLHSDLFYLLILLRNNEKISFPNKDQVNGIAWKLISSKDTQCLLWIIFAAEELRQQNPDSTLIQQRLTKAEEFPSFKIIFLLFIYNKSIPVNFQLLKRLAQHIKSVPKFKDLEKLINERISFIQTVDALNTPSQLFNPVKEDSTKTKCSLPIMNIPQPKSQLK